MSLASSGGSLFGGATYIALLGRLSLRCVSHSGGGRPAAVRTALQLDASVEENYTQDLHPFRSRRRRYPGRTTLPIVRLPVAVDDALSRLLTETRMEPSNFQLYAKQMNDRLSARQLPPERKEVQQNVKAFMRNKAEKDRQGIEARLATGGDVTPADTLLDEYDLIDDRGVEADRKLFKKLSRRLYNWKPLRFFDKTKCLVYAAVRMSQNYASVLRVLNEIAVRDADFKPQSLLDVGSGVGSVFWAARHLWPGDCSEILLVDTSTQMGYFSHDIIKESVLDAQEGPAVDHGNLFFRAFLPPGNDRQYDIVVCANTLCEMASHQQRIELIEQLWRKTQKYLVIVEAGSDLKSCYDAVIQARDYVIAGANQLDVKRAHALFCTQEEGGPPPLLDRALLAAVSAKKDWTEAQKFAVLREAVGPDAQLPTLLPHGHVFAPCPHDGACPKLQEIRPHCGFSVRYYAPSVMARTKTDAVTPRTERFSYVILRKGDRSKDDPYWPRLIADVQLRPRHVHCTLCTSAQQHGIVTVTKKRHGSGVYRCARNSSWGDLMPVVVGATALSPIKEPADLI